MSILDKRLLLEDLEARLDDLVTAADLRKILAAAGEVLDGYQVESSQAPGADDSDGLVRLFLEAKASEGKSEKTIGRYRYVLGRLQAAVNVPLNRVTVYHLRSFITSEMDRGISASTMEGLRSVWSAFYGWLFREGLIQKNPCDNLAPIRRPKVVRLPFTDVELTKLSDAAQDPRDKALLAFLEATGCRISEVCSVNSEDVDFVARQLKVLGKGSKERTVFINDVCKMRLTVYLDMRKDASPALFPGRQTDRMTPGGVRAMLKRLGAAAGVENVHPHRFRRTLATNLIDGGMAIQEVAVVLGHEKLDTTNGYVYTDQQNVEHAYRRCL